MHDADTRTGLIALGLVPALGRQAIARLLTHFGMLAAVLAASNEELQAVHGIGPKLAAAIRAVNLARVAAQVAAWEADGIAVLLPGEAAYPPRLAALAGSPAVLFVRGNVEALHVPRAVGIAGTRQPIPASLSLARELAETLAREGWTVVSGLARGVDTVAHTATLAAGGATVAALGGGVRQVYPPENRALAARILATGGALVAETPPDAHPDRAALVARNRLISGLSAAVVVIETGEHGGSMHAARFAAAQDRPVYAIANEAEGNRRLLANGARPLPPDATASARLLAELAQLKP